MDMPLAEIWQILEVRQMVFRPLVLREAIPVGIDALAQRLHDRQQISGARCHWLDGWQECGGMKIELLTICFSS